MDGDQTYGEKASVTKNLIKSLSFIYIQLNN